MVKVTNLDDSGSGSLQWAVNQPGPRIVVFDVSGVINGDVRIPHGDLTIAGQTAPGAGITIHGHLYTPYPTSFGNMIIRHIRVRPPEPDGNWPPAQHDAVQFSRNQLLILDHVDISHGVDENLDLWAGARDVTIQWSAITYPVLAGGHPDGDYHNYGIINGPDGGRISIHHNLFAHNRARTPALSQGPADVVNNVAYNVKTGFVHHNPADGDFNIVGNYYKDGPSTSLNPFYFDPENNPTSEYFVQGNYVDDPGIFEGRVDNPFDSTEYQSAYQYIYCCGISTSQFDHNSAFDFSNYSGYVPISTNDATTAYEAVLNYAGAWPRDIVNQWSVDETRDRTGSWGNRRPSDWMQGLTASQPPPDRDGDGMSDSWETANGLNPDDGGDHTTVMPSGYTAIEEYINQLADSLVPGSPVALVFMDGFEL
ncbi:MAG: hypothetical protein QNJ40_21615 [Xanthomonadales bacterium]|nr:hypothetical protein [Xanthomonadales bacterium]